MNKLSFASDSIVIYEQLRLFRLQYEEMVCLTIDRPYLLITTVSKQHFYVYISLSKIAKLLPDSFCLCSQSTIVNLLYVSSYEEMDGHAVIKLSNSDLFIVSRRCKKNVRNKLLHFDK